MEVGKVAMYRAKYVLVVIVLLLLHTVIAAANPPGKGEISGGPEGAIREIEVRYELSQAHNQPVVRGTYRWWSSRIPALQPDTVLWLEVSNAVNGSAYIRFQPVVPEQGQWAQALNSSPTWDTVLVAAWNGNQATRYVDARIAKQFWQNGFQVVGFQLSRKYTS